MKELRRADLQAQYLDSLSPPEVNNLNCALNGCNASLWLTIQAGEHTRELEPADDEVDADDSARDRQSEEYKGRRNNRRALDAMSRVWLFPIQSKSPNSPQSALPDINPKP